MIDNKIAALKELRKIPGVGKVIAMDLWNLGYRAIPDLRGEDADLMFIRHNDQKGAVQDICMLYTFRGAVYFANTHGQVQDPVKLNWWYWTDDNKMTSESKDREIRMSRNYSETIVK